MGWNYTNNGLSQIKSIGTSLTVLGALMLVFGNWQYVVNIRLAKLDMVQVPASRQFELALPALFGLAVLATGIAVILAGRRRQHAR